MCKRYSINEMRTVLHELTSPPAYCMQFVHEKNDYGILSQIYILQNCKNVKIKGMCRYISVKILEFRLHFKCLELNVGQSLG